MKFGTRGKLYKICRYKTYKTWNLTTYHIIWNKENVYMKFGKWGKLNIYHSYEIGKRKHLTNIANMKLSTHENLTNYHRG